METLPKVAVVIPKHYGVISQHYGVISRNHDRIHLPLFLLLMDLQSQWRQRVLYCSGYWDHLFFSQAYAWWAIVIVPQPSQPLTFGNVIFGCPASNFRATSKNMPFGNQAIFVCNTYLGIRGMGMGTSHANYMLQLQFLIGYINACLWDYIPTLEAWFNLGSYWVYDFWGPVIGVYCWGEGSPQFHKPRVV
jgi:hypothetical protein